MHFLKDVSKKDFQSSASNFINSRYAFYLDFIASEYDDRAQNALMHLKEQAQFVRVLGSYPRGSKLIGPIKKSLDILNKSNTFNCYYFLIITTNFTIIIIIIIIIKVPITKEYPSIQISSLESKKSRLKIGIIGFGKFGQFLGKKFSKNNDVYAIGRSDMSVAARNIGCEFFPWFDMASFAKTNCDVIILSCSIISFEEVLQSIPKDIFKGKLVVDVLSVKLTHVI